MRHYRLTIAAVTGLAMGACGVHPAPQPPRHVVPSPHITVTSPSRETQPQPVEARFKDCGDGTPPCVTYDDAPAAPGMYLVLGTNPYRALLLQTCNAEDYPTNLPCVWKHPDAKTGEWITLRKPTATS